MKRNKLYLLLVLLITVIFFTTATLCNQCVAAEEEKISTEAEETGEAEEAVQEEAEAEEEVQPAEGELAGDTEEETETEAEEESEEEETQVAKEAPTINLEVYEGPLYSQADDVCYWRVKAIVTGIPAPTVEFSKDDSNGSWGSRKAQVNIEDPADSYTLTATASNSEGTATDSIVLVWECNRDPKISDIVMMGEHFVGVEYTVSASASDPDGDSLSYSWSVDGGSLDSGSGNPVKWTMPSTVGNYQITVKVDDGNGGTASMTETVEVLVPLLAMEVPIVNSEGGIVLSVGSVIPYGIYAVGDTNANVCVKGYVSFDITALVGATVESAKLEANHDQVHGNCNSFCPLWVLSVNWEPGHIVPGDFNLPGDPITSFHSPDFSTDTDKLRIYLQNAIDSGRDRFQLMFAFTGMFSDGDNTHDSWGYFDRDIELNITYYP